MENIEKAKLDSVFQAGDGIADSALTEKLPPGCRVISIERHGDSYWASTARLDVELADGTDALFFIKLLLGEKGRLMVESEFESMQAIHQVCPSFVPTPIGYGSLASSPGTHFFLSAYMDFDTEMPGPEQFNQGLRTLHYNSTSPNGKFGFHRETFSGNLSQYTEWEDSWETFFSKSLRRALGHEIDVKGYDPEFDVLVPEIFGVVIPRLLRPLETQGRKVKPSLVHGDLWYANSASTVDGTRAMVFDACCFYAHNEYEFGQWMPACNRFGQEYLDDYHSRVQRSAPEEDYEGRLELYKLRFNTHVSALFADNPGLREQMLGDMRSLVRQYGHGGNVATCRASLDAVVGTASGKVEV